MAAEFHAAAAGLRNNPASADRKAAVERLKAEMAAVMPPMGDAAADAARQQLFRSVLQHAEQVARDAAVKRETVERSPHMAPIVERLEREAAEYRDALDAIAAAADAGWWRDHAGAVAMNPLGAAKFIAGDASALPAARRRPAPAPAPAIPAGS